MYYTVFLRKKTGLSIEERAVEKIQSGLWATATEGDAEQCACCLCNYSHSEKGERSPSPLNTKTQSIALQSSYVLLEEVNVTFYHVAKQQNQSVVDEDQLQMKLSNINANGVKITAADFRLITEIVNEKLAIFYN